MQQTEADIIAGCISGSIKAQEQLYKNYYSAMMLLCLRYTKNEADATDVLNQGFLKVFLNIHNYDAKKGSIYTWIRTIIINSCIDFIKQKARTEITCELDKATEIYIDAEVVHKINASQLLHFIRQLSPATQSIFNLYIMEGYNHREIAQMMNISEGTSKWHLSEARKNLQQMILSKEVKV